MHRRVLIAGVTGLVGRHLLQLLLDNPEIVNVVALTRRPLAIPHPQLTEAIVDFTHLEDFASPPVDDYFCCIGTTIRKAGSHAAFRDVDLVYPVAIARMALTAGATRCYFVSALGADVTSRVFYNRIKGELEAQLARLPFRTVVALRPSLLTGERTEFRLGERLAMAALRPLSALLPARYRPIDARLVAKALLTASGTSETGRFVVESDAIRGLAEA